MRRLRVEKVLFVAAFVAAAMASGRSARAGDYPKAATAPAGASVSVGASVGGSGASASASASANGSASKSDADAPSADAKDKGKDEKHEDEMDRPFILGLDMVIGSARTNTASGVVPPGSTGGIYGTTNTSTARVTNYSFIVEGGLLLTPGFGVGARIPLEGGTLFTTPNRATGAVGNVELEAGGEVNLAHNLDLELGLGLALPTAQGDQIPASGPQVPVVQGGINQSGYDRFAVQRAVAASRGYEDNALFEPYHFGIVPELKLRFGEHESWHIDPWVKLENLIATDSNYKFIDELVFGANIGVYACKAFEPAVRVWVNAPLTGADFTTVAVVEPEVRFHVGHVTPVLGAILPFAGPLTNPYAVGIRAAIGGRF